MIGGAELIDVCFVTIIAPIARARAREFRTNSDTESA
jgi:hypothetical protein